MSWLGQGKVCESRRKQKTKENRGENQFLDRVRESPSQGASLLKAAGTAGPSSRLGSCSICCWAFSAGKPARKRGNGNKDRVNQGETQQLQRHRVCTLALESREQPCLLVPLLIFFQLDFIFLQCLLHTRDDNLSLSVISLAKLAVVFKHLGANLF